MGLIVLQSTYGLYSNGSAACSVCGSITSSQGGWGMDSDAGLTSCERTVPDSSIPSESPSYTFTSPLSINDSLRDSSDSGGSALRASQAGVFVPRINPDPTKAVYGHTHCAQAPHPCDSNPSSLVFRASGQLQRV